MTTYQLITENKKLITAMYRAGYFNSSIMLHYQIYTFYRDWLNLDVDKTTAIEVTANYFNLTTRTVYTVIKQMETQN